MVFLLSKESSNRQAAVLTLRVLYPGFIQKAHIKGRFACVTCGCWFPAAAFVFYFLNYKMEVCPIATNGKKKELETNTGIRDREVRVINSDGSQLGVMATRDALRLAEEQNLDLVKIAPQGNPPVCKILDYGKHRFEQQKREKEARKNQKVIDVKEVRLSLNIDIADFNTKVGHAQKFLKAGHKLKVSIRFRGREMAHTNLGLDVQRRFAEALPEAVVDKQPKLEGRSPQK